MTTQPSEQKRKFWGKMVWISAISLVVTASSAVALPLIGTMKAFDAMSKTGSADPSELATGISTSIMIGMLAIPFAIASFVLFIIAILRHRKFSIPAD